jgi:hypothetical protein
VIRGVVLHISNEQPLLADIYALPSASDAGLVCTNVRAPDGKRPVFIDSTSSVFFFPYRVIRFIEIPPAEVERHLREGGATPGAASRQGVRPGDGGAADAAAMGGDWLPVPVGTGDPEIAADDPELDADLEIDEDFLRRIRDI